MSAQQVLPSNTSRECCKQTANETFDSCKVHVCAFMCLCIFKLHTSYEIKKLINSAEAYALVIQLNFFPFATLCGA